MFSKYSRQPVENPRRYCSRARVRRAGCLFICSVLLLGQFEVFCLTACAEIPLPTPRSHYETFKPGTSGLPLLMDLLKEVDPQIQQVLLGFAKASGFQGASSTNELNSADLKKLEDLAEAAGLPKELQISKEQALSLLKHVNWAPVRPQLLEFFVHQSRVEDMIPAKWGAIWIPIVHDSLLYFLDHLDNDRLLDKLVGLAYLPPGTSRGDYLKEFVSKVPSLQKMGQILARNPDLAPDYHDGARGFGKRYSHDDSGRTGSVHY